MKARSQAGIVAVLILLGGYVVADAVDAAPGILTATDKPLAPRAYPDEARFDVIDADVPASAQTGGLSTERIAAAAESLAADSRNTGNTSFVVQDLDGNVLYEMAGETGRLPASSIKILTSAAALYELGPNQTLPTTAIVSGDRLYLVGGGDIYLASDYGDPDSITGRAGLADLADQVAADFETRGLSSVELSVDTSLFTGAEYHENVQGSDRQFVMPMKPLAIDGGVVDGTHTLAPHADAADRFVELLEDRGIGVTAITAGTAPAPDESNTAGIVHSAPVRELVDHTLTVSDNSLAVVLGHLVAIERGLAADFDGSAKAVRDSLAEQGFDVSDLVMSDTAGLSIDNRVSARLLTDVLVSAVECGGCDIGSIPHGMPVSGLSGTLWNRFAEMPTSGLVRAKTGTLIAANALSGYAMAADGSVYAFAILIDGLESGTTGIVRPAIDEAVNAVFMEDENAG